VTPSCYEMLATVESASQTRLCVDHGRRMCSRPKCDNADCVMAPSFGMKGSKPRFCSKHAQEGMVNLLKIRARTCEEPECLRYPFFAVDMKHRPRFCSLHHPPGYINYYGDRFGRRTPPNNDD
jgi:hypothetical protein